MFRLLSCLGVLALVLSANIAAAEIRVGVASNFTHTAKLLSNAYVLLGNPAPVLLFGSTGKHAAQIRSGLPIDLLLAADAKRPKQLIEDQIGLKGSAETYAYGKLVFWSGRSDHASITSPEQLLAKVCETDSLIAIANPLLAPYGVAAKEVLANVSGERPCKAKLVTGENVAQAAHFANSGSVSAAFLPKSMEPYLAGGSSYNVPSTMHSPIEQKMILLSESSEAKKFYRFILSDKGKTIIRSNGYGTKHD